MSNDNDSTPETQPDHVNNTSVKQASQALNTRDDILGQARAFLRSPQVAHEDSPAKRAFLLEKGLTPEEADTLLHELPPTIPPRTYPQPPRSNLPHLLSGVAHLLTWIAGGSILMVLAYTRFILPRITRTLQARHTLVTHQNDLIHRLTGSLDELKTTQLQAFADLPHSQPTYEDKRYKDCHSLDGLAKARLAGSKEADAAPPTLVSYVRCAIEQSIAKDKQAPTADAITALLQNGTIPEVEHEDAVLNILHSTPIFLQTTDDTSVERWSYVSVSSSGPAPILNALSDLRSSLPSSSTTSPSDTGPALRGLLQSLASLTALATSHAYGLTKRAAFGQVEMSPGAEEVRKEIRALKGLVLNRRAFMGRGSSPVPTINMGMPV
jgi:hypothetical protein